MKRLIAHSYTLRQNMLNIIGICLCLYFSYHATFGTRSYAQQAYLEKEISRLAARYDDLKEQRTVLESRVVRLRPSSLDLDLLEERVRLVLGYSRPDDQIILY